MDFSLSSWRRKKEGVGEGRRVFVWTPLSSVVSPLVPHGERKKPEAVFRLIQVPMAPHEGARPSGNRRIQPPL